MRPRRLVGCVAVGLAGLGLAACGSVHPGSAAVVDGQSVSFDTVNNAAKAYCKITVQTSQQQGAQAMDYADLRRQAITDYVLNVVARHLEKDQNLSIKTSSYEISDDEKEQIDKVFKGQNLKEIIAALERSRQTLAIATALGEEKTGTKSSDETGQQLANVGHEEIIKAYKSSDVSFDPRFALSDSAQQIAKTGSLSVSAVKESDQDPQNLPTFQRCS